MKKLTLISFFLVVAVCAKGQTAKNTNRKDSSNIYYQALTQYFIYLEANTKIIPDSIYLEDDYKLSTDSILKQVNLTTVILVKWNELVGLLKKNKTVTLYRIFPLKFSDGLFSVSCIPFLATFQKRKNNIRLLNAGGFEVFFKYQNNEFVFDRVKAYGI